MTQKNLSVNRTKELLIKNTHEYTCTHMYTRRIHVYTYVYTRIQEYTSESKDLAKICYENKTDKKTIKNKEKWKWFFQKYFLL